jgi:Holliday junction DNA helicase RuvA
MIQYLEGKIQQKNSQGIILMTNGIGFFLTCPFSTLRQLGPIGSDCSLFVLTDFRQEKLQLYGFIEERDRVFFQDLLSISGIGPKIALNFLGPYQASELTQFIINQDAEALGGIPGVGAKKAERLLFESGSKNARKILSSQTQSQSLEDEVSSALKNMGFLKQEIKRVLNEMDLSSNNLSVEDAIRLALKSSV